MSTQKKSRVTAADYSHSYDGKHGTLYIHKVSFENGDSGEYLSKAQQQDKFVAGQEAEYTIERGPDYQGLPQYKVKPYYDPGAVSGSGSSYGGGSYSGKSYGKGNNVSFAASYAKDVMVAFASNGAKVDGEMWKQWADFMLDWMNRNS